MSISSSRQRARQAKRGRGGVAEARDPGDLVTFESEHNEPMQAQDRRRAPEVIAERWLVVRAGGDELDRLDAPPAAAAIELGDGCPALVLDRFWWHGQPGVVGKQFDQALDVSAL